MGWQARRDSNPQHPDLESGALPIRATGLLRVNPSIRFIVGNVKPSIKKGPGLAARSFFQGGKGKRLKGPKCNLSPDATKTDFADAEVRVEPAAVCTARITPIDAPGTAPQDEAGFIVFKQAAGPLPDIAGHVVAAGRADAVGIARHRCGLADTGFLGVALIAVEFSPQGYSRPSVPRAARSVQCWGLSKGRESILNPLTLALTRPGERESSRELPGIIYLTLQIFSKSPVCSKRTGGPVFFLRL